MDRSGNRHRIYRHRLPRHRIEGWVQPSLPGLGHQLRRRRASIKRRYRRHRSPTVPDAPLELRASQDVGRRIDLSWSTPADDGGAYITGYRIEVSGDGSNWSDLVTNTETSTTTYTHTGLRGVDTRHYRVYAINSAGTGPASDVATGLPLPRPYLVNRES